MDEQFSAVAKLSTCQYSSLKVTGLKYRDRDGGTFQTSCVTHT